jgi:hypothetical protein
MGIVILLYGLLEENNKYKLKYLWYAKRDIQ